MPVNNEDCRAARELIKDAMFRDMLGPGSERLCGFEPKDEVICERQIKYRYSVGLLFPCPPQGGSDINIANIDENIPVENDDLEQDEDDNDEEADAQNEVQPGGGGRPDDEDDGEDLSHMAHEFAPSAMGISFLLPENQNLDSINVHVKAAFYSPARNEINIRNACCVKLLCPVNFVTPAHQEFLRRQLIVLEGVKLYFQSAPDEERQNGLLENCREFAEQQCRPVSQNQNFMNRVRALRERPEIDLPKIICQDRCFEKGRWFVQCSQEFPAETDLLRNLAKFIACVKKIYKQYFSGLKRHEAEWSGSLADIDNEHPPVLFPDANNNGHGLTVSREIHNNNFYSVFISNRTDDKRIFAQPEIRISADNPVIQALPNRSLQDSPEESMLKMRYRKQKQYAKGHGCSVGWGTPDGYAVSEIHTTFIPSQSINAPDWEIRPIEGSNIPNDELQQSVQMIFLSDSRNVNKDAKIHVLNSFVDNYEAWIDRLDRTAHDDQEIQDHYLDSATRTVELCREALRRMRAGVDLLRDDAAVYRAFCLANEAIVRSRLKDEPLPDPENGPKWRLFQLGFILLTLDSLVKPNAQERDIVDLLWFQTGGGKTEAYLALTALAIFYRHLTGNRNTERIKGTTVIMRYTLRLLTSQQFTRAAALICACDRIRQEQTISDVPITLGLWVGGGGSGIPNRLAGQGNDTVADIYRRLQNPAEDNPFQPKKCPWCDTDLDQRQDGRGMGFRYYISGRGRPGRFEIYCLNPDCPYSQDALPIQIIDECLYNDPPTLLFGTVDKFAQLAFKEDAGIFFGLRAGERIHPAPALIIQDEMHLITDELGSMVGIYETAVKGLCKLHGGNYPKIIASTATVRRASEQCKSLYGCRDICQFPPSGLDAGDSYFAKEDKNPEKPGREYVALQSSGQTASTTLIRMIASLLFRIEHLEMANDEVKDLYYTLVSYFNSLRELGACETWVAADITERIEQLAKNDYLPVRRLYSKNLCSRLSAAAIPAILDKLIHNTYPQQDDRRPVDILLSSNMLSVGIDVDRFGVMVVNGHPKKNAEFIQASSRVGRQLPSSGLVFTLYNGAKARDCSYFEVFPDYIHSFYKYVEPATVTPFTKAARLKALHAVLVILMRHAINGCYDDNALGHLQQLDQNDFAELREIIMQKVSTAVGATGFDHDAVADQLEDLIRNLCEVIQRNQDRITCYTRNHYQNGTPLLKKAEDANAAQGLDNSIPWVTMNSVRSVDKMVNAKVKGEE